MEELLKNKIAEMSKKELKDFIRNCPHQVGELAKENGMFAYKIVIMFCDVLDDIEHIKNILN